MAPTSIANVNVAARLSKFARLMPEAVAVVETRGRNRLGRQTYRQITFRQLDDDSDRIARGLGEMGVRRGTRLALLVPQGIDFITLVFALLKSGAVAVLIDPGMGRRNLVKCLAAAEPEGFVAVPVAQMIRILLRRHFRKTRCNVTVGRPWFWGGPTLEQLRAGSWAGCEPPATNANDPAAIIFTTGSTGPPKGVLYRHGNFDAQVDQIRDFYDIQPGQVDLPCFPLFGLFNCAMGVTAVLPDMDPSRPAQVNPANITQAIEDWKVMQAFGSPAIWNRVGQYCQQHKMQLPTVQRILSAGAPVPAAVLEQMKACIHPAGDIHTPYGATEALPVASISATQVLGETSARTRRGAGVCVGRRFSGIAWKIIRIVEGPVHRLEQAQELAPGEIGELIVSGSVVTREYVTRTESNALGKIADGQTIWHRMGDSGYLDQQDRFWFCGRVAHRVLTDNGPMYTICCEAIFNQHPDIFRCALVGIGPAPHQRPVVVLEPLQGRMPRSEQQKDRLFDELRRLGADNPITAKIDTFLLHPALPVDIRHNVKIFREKLAVWASRRLAIR